MEIESCKVVAESKTNFKVNCIRKKKFIGILQKCREKSIFSVFWTIYRKVFNLNNLGNFFSRSKTKQLFSLTNAYFPISIIKKWAGK